LELSDVSNEKSLIIEQKEKLKVGQMYFRSQAKSLMPDVCARSNIGFLTLSRELNRPTASLEGAAVPALLMRLKNVIA
jgi:hypothetical protein